MAVHVASQREEVFSTSILLERMTVLKLRCNFLQSLFYDRTALRHKACATLVYRLARIQISPIPCNDIS